MKHQMKKGREGFTVVDGPLAGRQFVPKQTYNDAELTGLAAADRARFAPVAEKQAAPAAKSAGKGGKS